MNWIETKSNLKQYIDHTPFLYPESSECKTTWIQFYAHHTIIHTLRPFHVPNDGYIHIYPFIINIHSSRSRQSNGRRRARNNYSCDEFTGLSISWGQLKKNDTLSIFDNDSLYRNCYSFILKYSLFSKK